MLFKLLFASLGPRPNGHCSVLMTCTNPGGDSEDVDNVQERACWLRLSRHYDALNYLNILKELFTLPCALTFSLSSHQSVPTIALGCSYNSTQRNSNNNAAMLLQQQTNKHPTGVAHNSTQLFSHCIVAYQCPETVLLCESLSAVSYIDTYEISSP